MSSRSGFKDHVYRLYLDRKLYLATIKLQAELGLGKSFSAMLIYVEGLHARDILSEADYEVYKAKYSVGLNVETKTPTQINEQETKENRDRQLNRHFKLVFEQWDQLKPHAKQKHLENAEKENIKWARKVLEKGSQEKEASI